MRRRRAEKRELKGDRRFDSPLLAAMIAIVMERGKKSTAERVVYGALNQIGKENEGVDPLAYMEEALDNVKPRLEVKSRRVGGATYQVPIEVTPDRQLSLALRWIKDYARGRKGVPMERALAMEFMDAHNNQGSAVKKREDTFKMAQANKAFAHYRW